MSDVFQDAHIFCKHRRELGMLAQYCDCSGQQVAQVAATDQ